MNKQAIGYESAKVCPKCAKELSPRGGIVDGGVNYKVCWGCGYETTEIVQKEKRV